MGIDIGTMNLVAARRDESGKVQASRIRDAFLDLPADSKKMLRLAEVNYIEQGDEIIIVGDAALETANLFGRDVRRPLKDGLISAGETDAQTILAILIKHILGEPRESDEVCYFSVPAAPVDAPDRDVIYHQGVFDRILTELGYDPEASNEAMGIIFAETAADKFSGLALSFGSGMTNVALAVNTIEGLSFSIARCLAADFPVIIPSGVTTMEHLSPGDEVLDAFGDFVPVIEKMDNGSRESLVEITLENLPAFPHKLTSDHRVFVRRRFGWEWVEAGEVTVGDTVGIPTIQAQRGSGSSYYFGRDNAKNVTVAGARNLGRFFGMFLGDGSCGGSAKCGPRYVQLAINRRDQHLVEKYANVCATLFHRDVEIVDEDAENLTRVKLHLTPVARHMRERFYTENGVKVFPLALSKVSNQAALGIIEGLLDSDGHEDPKRHTVTNTALPVVLLLHHLLNRFGIGHGISRRPPRTGGVNSRGVRIEGRKETFEVCVRGHVAKNLLDTMLAVEGHQVFDKFPDFATFRVSSVGEVPYEGRIYDIQVASPHHSFSSPGMVVHNCGDWIDAGAAKALGTTPARMCALKEGGINLMTPASTEAEALAFYYKHLIEYCLKHIRQEFKKIQGRFALPGPIPLIISGGTSKAEGFVEFFTEVFDRKRKRFPFEISEIRQANDPLNAVAYGLLLQANQAYEE